MSLPSKGIVSNDGAIASLSNWSEYANLDDHSFRGLWPRQRAPLSISSVFLSLSLRQFLFLRLWLEARISFSRSLVTRHLLFYSYFRTQITARVLAFFLSLSLYFSPFFPFFSYTSLLTSFLFLSLPLYFSFSSIFFLL